MTDIILTDTNPKRLARKVNGYFVDEDSLWNINNFWANSNPDGGPKVVWGVNLNDSYGAAPTGTKIEIYLLKGDDYAVADELFAGEEDAWTWAAATVIKNGKIFYTFPVIRSPE